MQQQRISPDQIWFFKPIDQLIRRLKQNTNDNKYFIELFQRKQLIINLMQQGKLDAKSYFKFVKKGYKIQKLKKYAQQDLIQYQGTYQQNVQSWFQGKVNETGQQFQNQQTKYKILTKSQQKEQQNVQKGNHKETNKNVSTCQTNTSANSNYQNKSAQNIQQIKVNLNINQISNLKAIDHYLKKYQQSCYKNTFMQLLERKIKILKLIQNGSLKYNKYVEFTNKTLMQTNKQLIYQYFLFKYSQELKKHLKLDIQFINDIYQNNTQKWFNQMFKQSKNNYSLQKNIYEKHEKGILVEKYKQIQLDFDDQNKQQQKQIEPQECYSFMVLDQFMDRNDQIPKTYVKLYKKKQQLLQLVQKKQLDPKVYQEMIIKGLKKIKKDYIKIYYQIDLQNIKNLYNSNLKQWFNISIDQTKAALMLQDQKYQQFKSQLPVNKIIKKQSLQQKKNIKKQQKIQQDSQIVKINFQISQMYSLKILNDKLINCKQNNQIFIKLFYQKNKIIDMMSQRQLNAQNYKKIIQKMLQNPSLDQQIKTQIQFQISQIDDFHQGVVQKWFQEIVQSTGANYQSQSQRYQQLTNKNINIQNKQKITFPQASQVLSFTVINKSFKIFASNVEFIQILCEKKQRFIDWINNSKLNGDKYKAMSQKILNSTKNQWIKLNIEQEFNQLGKQFNGNTQKWFSYLTKLLKQTQICEDKTQNSKQSAIQKINKGSKKSKINYFIHQMSQYESLCKYYKTHKLNPSKNQTIKIYLTGPRKQVADIIQNIRQNSQYDIYSYCKKNFPSFSDNLFGQKSQEYSEKIKQYIIHFNEYIKNITEYSKKLKKTVNTKNLEKCKKIIDQSNQNIKYLNSLKSSSKLIPLPQIQETKVVIPHIDQFTQLDPNQIQIKINKIENLKDSCIMKIYYLGKMVKQQKIKNGSTKIVIKIRLQEKDMQNIMKGQPNYISVNLSQKGWFSTTQIGTQYFKTQFIRSNIFQETINVGEVSITYQSRVRMAKKPITSQLTQYKLIKYPAFENIPSVEQQLIEKFATKKK